MDSEVKHNLNNENLSGKKKTAVNSGSHLKLILNVTFGGVFAALILIATQFKLPSGIGTGYVNLGDGFILVGAYLLGPAAFFPAAIGSALADLLAGSPIYIPATFIIKGLMGLTAGFLLKSGNITLMRKIIAFITAEVIMVGGYFIFESLPFMYGIAAAAVSVIPNLAQAAVGILIGMILTALFAKQRVSIRQKLM